MAKKTTKDRYDRAPKNISRVGAHRSPRRRGGGLLALVWALIAIIVLVGAGIVAILAINGKLDEGLGGLNLRPGASSPAPTQTASAPPETTPPTDEAEPTEPEEEPTPEVVPTRDPDLTVVVLNGTTIAGLAGDLTDELSGLGWSLADPANAAESDETTTVVYYADPDDEGAALGLVEDLESHVSDVEALPADGGDSEAGDLTVVIGTDFAS